MDYDGGIINPWFPDYECDTTQLDHAVLIVGYGTEDGTPFWVRDEQRACMCMCVCVCLCVCVCVFVCMCVCVCVTVLLFPLRVYVSENCTLFSFSSSRLLKILGALTGERAVTSGMSSVLRWLCCCGECVCELVPDVIPFSMYRGEGLCGINNAVTSVIM